MGQARVDQSSFTQGQLDPRVQARTDWDSYYKGAKELTNCLVIPQGGVQRRWGTKFVYELGFADSDFQYAEIYAMIYNDNIIYLLEFEVNLIKVFLENLIVASIVTQFQKEDIPTLRFSQVQTRLIVTSGNFAPQQLVRSADGPSNITAFSNVNNTLTANTGYASGVYPVQFQLTGVGNLPVTNPQIYAGRDYFIKLGAANTFKVFSTSEDAAAGINFYTITSDGVNAAVNVQNTWTISNIVFKNLPSYDFNGGYTAITFTPSAITGTITLTASAAIFTAAMVGGVYTGNGGIVRLTVFTDTTHMTGIVIEPFPNTTAIQGLVSFLGEPAWSNARGWPKTSSFIQNRLVLANTTLLPSGQWLSVINDVYNFDDSQTLADDAISSYPESGNMSVIQSMTSGRSMVVHTNTGNFSSPVQTEIVLTPTSYLLTEQNKYGVGNLQPVFIDNQIFFVDRSGNNVINMIWEFSQSSYVTNTVSVKASDLINNPIDMTAFFEPNYIDGFFVIFVNSDGTATALQTLNEENILAFSGLKTYSNIITSKSLLSNQTQDSYFKVTAAQNRCWFLVSREKLLASNTRNITGFNAVANTLHAVGLGPLTGFRIKFATTGTLPITNPTINTTDWFWSNSTIDNFQVFSSESDAKNDVNPFTILSAGTNSTVTPYVILSVLNIEEVDFSVYTDSTLTQTYTNPTSVITNLDHLEGQVVNVVADSYVLNNNVVFGGQITLENAASVVSVGLPMTSTLVPLPPVIPGAPGALYMQRHIRNLYVNYYQTVGATVQGYDMPVNQLQNLLIGQIPTPQTGVFEYTMMEGFEGATPTDIVISQSLPLPMTIIGLSYVLEV